MSNQVVSHNVYFEGKVQSLGLETEKGKATVGVMKKGNYTFSTASAEVMFVVSGVLHAKLDDSGFRAYKAHEQFDVAANISFEVNCEADVAYICYYE